jgi:hypothetical protein
VELVNMRYQRKREAAAPGLRARKR